MLVLQYLTAEFVKTLTTRYEKLLNWSLKPDWESQQVSYFQTDFSLIYIHGYAIESSFRISKPYVGFSISGCDFYKKPVLKCMKIFDICV